MFTSVIQFQNQNSTGFHSEPSFESCGNRATDRMEVKKYNIQKPGSHFHDDVFNDLIFLNTIKEKRYDVR